MNDSDKKVGGAASKDAIRTCGSYSPPCALHAVDPAYARHLTKHELLEFLNEVLERERAGERALIPLMAESNEKALHSALSRAVIDQARFCARLSRHIRDLGGTPSPAIASFYDKLMAMSGLLERLAFLNQRQASLIRRLREVLPSVRDGRLYDDLKAVLRFHEVGARRCDRFLKGQRRRSRPEGASPKGTYGATP